MCKTCRVFNTAASAAQCLHEVPQLHRRKFPETVLDLALGPLQEDPARGPVPLAAREVQPPAHRPGPHLRIGLHLRSEEHTSELQSQSNLVCRLLLEKKKKTDKYKSNTYICSPISP